MVAREPKATTDVVKSKSEVMKRDDFSWHEGIGMAQLASLVSSYGFHGHPNHKSISEILSIFRDSPAEEVLEKQNNDFNPILLQFIDGLQALGIHDEIQLWIKKAKLPNIIDPNKARLVTALEATEEKAGPSVYWGMVAKRHNEHPLFRQLRDILEMRHLFDKVEFRLWESIAEIAVMGDHDPACLDALTALLRKPKKLAGNREPQQVDLMIQMKRFVLLKGVSVNKASRELAQGYDPKNAQRLAKRFRYKMKLRTPIDD